MKNGTGEELPMNGRISCWLRKRIKPREKRMGGQIGIMSNVLSNLGFNCLVYFPLLSKEQSKLFERNPNLKFLTKDGWKPSGIYFKNVPTKINWIFEFSKGEKLFDVVAKDSSRFIAASRPDEDRIKSPLLESKVDEINEKADIAILSGYHDVRKKYSDSTYLKEIKAGERFLKKLKIPTQLEFANVSDVRIRRAIINHIASHVDVLSMDVNELISILDLIKKYPRRKERDSIWNYEALKIILKELNLKCVKIHRKHYFLSVSNGYLKKDYIKKAYLISRGFDYVKSKKGRIKDWNELKIASKVKPSLRGIKEKKKLEKYLRDNKEKLDVVIVPNKVNPNPKTTVGLGDVLSGGSFAIENLLSVRGR